MSKYEKDFNMRKPETHQAETVDCPSAPDEQMDPIGYFLIRVNEGKLEAGLCSYDMVNIIKKVWRGGKPQDVYQQIVTDMPEIMQVHVGYLSKELTRAWICMKLGVKFVQDGRADGTFPEVEWLLRKDGSPQ